MLNFSPKIRLGMLIKVMLKKTCIFYTLQQISLKHRFRTKDIISSYSYKIHKLMMMPFGRKSFVAWSRK